MKVFPLLLKLRPIVWFESLNESSLIVSLIAVFNWVRPPCYSDLSVRSCMGVNCPPDFKRKLYFSYTLLPVFPFFFFFFSFFFLLLLYMSLDFEKVGWPSRQFGDLVSLEQSSSILSGSFGLPSTCWTSSAVFPIVCIFMTFKTPEVYCR